MSFKKELKLKSKDQESYYVRNILELKLGFPKVEGFQLPMRPAIFKNRKVQIDKIN